MPHQDLEWTIVPLTYLLLCFSLLLLVFRLVFKLGWLTAVCLALIAGTAFLIFYLSSSVEPGPIPGWVMLLPLPIAVAILIFHFCSAAHGEDSSVKAAERAKILRMVEDGKISADEGSELLDAMGRSSALRGQEKFSRADIVMLVGAALVILGFFLPWVYSQIGGVLGYQAGYDWRAIGWTIFIVGILSAVPVFVTPKDFLYKISMLQIFLTLIGLVLVISVLVRAGEHLGAGLIFCLAGFIVELLASGAKFRKLAA